MSDGVPITVLHGHLNRLEKILIENQKTFMAQSHQVGVDVGFLQGMAFVKEDIGTWQPRPGAGIASTLAELRVHIQELITERCKE